MALSVQNLDASVEFYGVFGFESVFDWVSDDKNLSIVHLKQGEILLELFCFKETSAAPTSSLSLATDLPRVGIKHFGLQANDIHEAKKHLQALGLADDIEVIKGRTGIDYFFIKDPSGILVEVVQDERNL